jgi:hypothetical protein
LRPIAHVMPDSVDLDREPRLGAIEIQHVEADRMLAVKDRRSWDARPQPAP